MTTLQVVFEEAKKLPKKKQEELAAWILDELHWDKLFSDSQDMLGKLADEALVEHVQGKTKPLSPDIL
ncbi:MAG: hypothetical protein WCP97_03690 [bacterium]